MTSTNMIIIGVAVVVLLAVAIFRNGGPRVTEIDRTVRRKKEDER